MSSVFAFVRIILALFAAALLAGCARKEAKAAPTSHSLKGQWIAKVDPSGADPKNPEAVAAVAAAKQFEAVNDLQFPSEDRYAFSTGGCLVEGTAEKSGLSVTLNPEKINGLAPDDAKKGGAAFRPDTVLPMTLRMSEDGTVLAMPAGQYGEKLVFLRFHPQVGADETSGDERSYVGRWHVEQMEGMTERHRSGGFDYLLNRTAVNLQRDHRFQMRFIYRFEGTWKRSPAGIELTYASGRMTLQSQNGRLILGSPDGKVRLNLAR